MVFGCKQNSWDDYTFVFVGVYDLDFDDKSGKCLTLFGNL